MSIDVILICLCCFLLILVFFLSYKLYRFSIIIIDVEDAIEQSLDILDRKYYKIGEILEKPVFFDSVEIRQVLAEINESQRAILLVANILTTNARMGSESKNEEKNV